MAKERAGAQVLLPVRLGTLLRCPLVCFWPRPLVAAGASVVAMVWCLRALEEKVGILSEEREVD